MEDLYEITENIDVIEIFKNEFLNKYHEGFLADVRVAVKYYIESIKDVEQNNKDGEYEQYAWDIYNESKDEIKLELDQFKVEFHQEVEESFMSFLVTRFFPDKDYCDVLEQNSDFQTQIVSTEITGDYREEMLDVAFKEFDPKDEYR